MSEQAVPPARKLRFLPAALAGWLAYLAMDFLTHGVLFAAWWRSTEQYWRPPDDLFRSIPFGYASFAIYCAGITWLVVRLYGQCPSLMAGLRLGTIGGLMYGVAVALGVYSALRLPVSALVVWPVSFLAASGGAGAATGWVLDAEWPWRRVAFVFGAAVLLFAVGVILQNLLSPTADR